MTSPYRQELDRRLLALDDATAADYDLAFQNAVLALISYNKNELTVTRPLLARPLTTGGLWKHPERKEQLFQAFQRAKNTIPSSVPQPFSGPLPLPPGWVPSSSSFGLFEALPPSLPLPPRQAIYTGLNGTISYANLKEAQPVVHSTAEEEKEFYQGEQANAEQDFALNELGLEESGSSSSDDDEEEKGSGKSKTLTTAELKAEIERCQAVVTRYAQADPKTLTDDQWDDFEQCQKDLGNLPELLKLRRMLGKEEVQENKEGGFGHWTNTISIIHRLINRDKSRNLNSLIWNDDAKSIIANEAKNHPEEYQAFWEPIVDWFTEDRRQSRYRLYRAIVEFFETNACRPLAKMPMLATDSTQWRVEGYWWNVDYPNQSASLPFVVPRQHRWSGWELFLKSLIAVESDAKTTRSAPLLPISPGPKCKICGWQDAKDSLDYTVTPPSLGEPRYRWTALVKHYVGFHNYQPTFEFQQLIRTRAVSNDVASITPTQLERVTQPRDIPDVDAWYFSPDELRDACQ